MKAKLRLFQINKSWKSLLPLDVFYKKYWRESLRLKWNDAIPKHRDVGKYDSQVKHTSIWTSHIPTIQ